MAEISKIVGLPYTINYTFADVFINGDYQGTYYVTDQVEKGKERVNISDDGFLIEDDKYYKDESIYFTTDKKQINYTFKYPKKLKASDESYLWIQSFMNNVEEALYSGDETSYLDLIDIDTFARWFIIEELLGNYDSNVYYVLVIEIKNCKCIRSGMQSGLWDWLILKMELGKRLSVARQ